MATENDNTQNNEQQDNIERNDDTSIDNLSKELDDALNQYVEDTTGPTQRRQPTADAQDKAQQQSGDQRQQRQQPARGQQQDTQGQDDATRQQRQVVDRTPQDRSLQPPARQYGRNFVTDAGGNIIDAQGRRVAATGLERKIFNRMYNSFSNIENEHTAFKQKIEAYENSDSAAKQLGLSLEERAMGLRLASAWKRSPADTINFLLNQASSAGIDVSAIRQGGVDMSAFGTLLQERIDAALEPFKFIIADRQQQTELREAEQRALEDLNTFYSSNPNAQMHSPVIAAIMQRSDETGNPLSMQEAWLTLQLHAKDNGWDMSKPLQAQAQATMNGQATNNGRPTGGQGNQRQLPNMNGRAAGNGVVANNRGAAKADDSWEDIVRDSVRDATGYDLQV